MTTSGRVRRAWIIPLVAAASSFAPRFSHAGPPQDTTHVCIAAFDDGQRLRTDGKLRAAHDKLVICSQRECPAVLREDCAGVLREVEAATPTIVLSAADRDGHDLTDVEVTLEGKSLTSHLDGRALSVDPGKLALEFTKKPWAPVKMEIVVREGDKNRPVKALLGPPKEMADDRQDGKPDTPPRSFVAWAVPVGFGIVGVGAVAFATATRIRIGNEADDLRGTCAPDCAQADRDRLSSDLVAANIGFGVGIGCIALAVASWFILAPRPVVRANGNGVALAW